MSLHRHAPDFKEWTVFLDGAPVDDVWFASTEAPGLVSVIRPEGAYRRRVVLWGQVEIRPAAPKTDGCLLRKDDSNHATEEGHTDREPRSAPGPLVELRPPGYAAPAEASAPAGGAPGRVRETRVTETREAKQRHWEQLALAL